MNYKAFKISYCYNGFYIHVLVSEDACGAPKISHGEVVPQKSVYLRGESVQIRCSPRCAFPDGGTEVTVMCQGRNTWSSEPNCACE